MIRINKLLRAVKTINKIPMRAGPGWDRPDVPQTQFVETDRRVTPFLFSGLIWKLFIHFLTHQCQNFTLLKQKFMKEDSLRLFHLLHQFGEFYWVQHSAFICSMNS